MSNYYCSGGCPLSTPKKEAYATTTTKPKVTTVSEKAAKCTFAAAKEVKTEGKNDQVPPPGGAKIESKDASGAVKEVKTEANNDQVPPLGGVKIKSEDAAGAVKEVKTEGKNDQVPPPAGAKIEAKDAGAVQVKEEVKVACG